MIHKPRDHKGLLTHSRPQLQAIKKGKKGGSLGGKGSTQRSIPPLLPQHHCKCTDRDSGQHCCDQSHSTGEAEMRQSFEKGKISCCKISATYNHLQQEGALGPNQGPHPPPQAIVQ